MVEVLVIPDGGAQPLKPSATTRLHVATALELARTPVLDSLAREGEVLAVQTVPPGLSPGSETGLPGLLGVALDSPPGRGWIDAAAHGIDVPQGTAAWRADVVYRDGRRASVRQARDVSSHLGAGVHAVAGHRLVIVAAQRPAERRLLGLEVRVWPGGEPLHGTVPEPTTVVCARGAAAGCGRLLGADVITPPGATGDVDSDLQAKAVAAIAALAAGARRVVVHAGAPDEAAHRRDQGAVVNALERVDAELLAPLRASVASHGGRLLVCPDHGTDPATGDHDDAPVPALRWGRGTEASGPSVMTERAIAGREPIAAPDLLAAGAVFA